MTLLLWTLALFLPDDQEATRLAALFKARYAMSAGRFEEALSFIDQAMALSEKDAEAAMLRIEVMLEANANNPLRGLTQQQELVNTLFNYCQDYPEDYRFPMTLGVHLVKEPMALKNGFDASADSFLEKALNLLKGHPEEIQDISDVRYYLGLFHYRSQSFYEASIHFREVIRLENDASWAWFYAARAFDASHQLRSALVAYERYMVLASLDPLDYEVPVPFTVHLLRLLVQPGDEQLAGLLNYLKDEPVQGNLHYQAASRLMAVGHYQLAETVLLDLPVASRKLNHQRLLAGIMMRQHHYDDLHREMMAAIALAKDETSKAFLSEFAIEAAYNARNYEAVLKIRDMHPRTLGLDVKLDLMAAFAQILAQQGIDRWERLLLDHQGTPLVTFLENRLEELDIQALVQMDVFERFMEWEDYPRAKEALTLLKGMDPNVFPDGDETLIIDYMMGEKHRAYSGYEELIQRLPNRLDLKNNYGYFLSEDGHDLDRAKALLIEAVAGEPENGAYLDSLAWVHYRCGNFAEAKRLLHKALSFDAEDPEKLEHLGDVFFALGEFYEARRAWVRALDAGAGDYMRILNKLDPQ